ncbi:MAG: histidine kinase [Comamonas sp. SCN 65-56]|uniref:sensor histidine kinase n=1 Tax=Comamonas sp. SCN 65-56 TaxID=1660095 RepID=UPI00086F1FFD|nr:sensor histidine kinase [Comamonas sp. SCN 65-56]ODS91715.1 MAG: histidine kinase [Comamonas sp. SCN 65-56]
MKNSLRLRLLVGTLAWLLLSIAAAGWGLRALLQGHIAQQLVVQLVMDLDHLSGSIDWAPDGRLDVDKQPDARLAQPLSGLYWQIDRLGAQPQAGLARSRSLWDQTLQLPAAPAAYLAQGHSVLQLHDAQGHALLAVARSVQLADEGAPPLRLVVAGDKALIAEPLGRFTHILLLALGALALGLALAVALQLQLALRPLTTLRQRLAAVRAGQAERLEGGFAQELEPLVNEFNHVLGENAEMVRRARAQAGNLAHAVNTPLTILANAAQGQQTPLALLVREQAEAARRQVDWHLARARASAAVRATGLATPVLEPLQALLRTMARLHEERGVTFALAPGVRDARFRGEAQDLYEMLGNLIDNAGKWARARVLVDLAQDGGMLHFTIDDDGPGLPEAERARIFERGVQLADTEGARAGAGLGLDIVRSLAETYGGSVHADDSPLGGLRMRLELPAAS